MKKIDERKKKRFKKNKKMKTIKIKNLTKKD